MAAPVYPEATLASQATFRAVMNALARPGEIQMARIASAPAGLAAGAAAIIKALADFETPVWLDRALAAAAGTADWIRFETGAPITADPANATFAIVNDALSMPDFVEFAQGTEEYPDRSTTMIIQIEHFSGTSFSLEGPGISGTRRLEAGPLPTDFAARLAANRNAYPCGIDVVLTAGEALAGLPRSVRIRHAET